MPTDPPSPNTVGNRSLFDVLPDETRRSLLRTAGRRRFRRSDVIFHAGDPGGTLHVIDRGHVAIRTSSILGDVLTLAVLGPGDVFGEQALLGPGHHAVSAITLESADTRVITRADFDRLLADHPAVSELVIGTLAAQVLRLSELLLEALYQPAEARIVRRLDAIAESYAAGMAVGPVSIPLTQHDLATMAGTSRPTVNRVLRRLHAGGIIELGRGRIGVLDRPALAAAAA